MGFECECLTYKEIGEMAFCVRQRLGLFMRKMRHERAGISLSNAGAVSGISPTTIIRLEHAKTNMSLDTFIRYFLSLGIDIEEVFACLCNQDEEITTEEVDEWLRR